MKQIFRLNREEMHDAGVYSISKGVPTLNTPNHPPALQTESQEPYFKCRHVVALFGFAVLASFSIHRVNVSVGIVAMVNNTALPKESGHSSDSCPAPNTTENSTAEVKMQEGEFDWSPVSQGYIQSSSYFGYVFSLIITGKATERFGCKWLLFWGVFLASLTTLLSPFAAWWNINVLIAVQAVRGISQGVFEPAVSILVANWSPKFERGYFATCMHVGRAVGFLIGGIGTGLLCRSDLLGGWPSAFYIFGLPGVILSLLIALFLHENPGMHPSISKAEATFILSNQENVLSKRRPDVPWRSIFTSVPFYALCFAYFGMNWATTHLMVLNPTYLGTILHFPIDQNGMLTSAPYVLTIIFGLGGSWISSDLISRKCMGVDKARKICNTIGYIGYVVGLFGIYVAQCDRPWTIASTVLSLALSGFVIPGCLIVSADMSPTFAGTVTSLVTSIGGTASFIFPLIAGGMTEGKQTLEQWNKIIFISIGVALTSGISFAVFGSANVQPWNFVREKNIEKEKAEENSQYTRL